MRFNDVVEVGQWLKSIHPDIPLRINTNGLSDLVFGEPTASRLAGIFDTVSISLNSSTAQKYLDVTRNRFGLASYDAMLSFAKACQRYVPNVARKKSQPARKCVIHMDFISVYVLMRQIKKFCIFSLKTAENTSGKEVFFYGKSR